MLNINAGELGVDSIDAVNFLKTVNQEFSVDILAEESAGFGQRRDLINHLGG